MHGVLYIKKNILLLDHKLIVKKKSVALGP